MVVQSEYQCFTNSQAPTLLPLSLVCCWLWLPAVPGAMLASSWVSLGPRFARELAGQGALLSGLFCSAASFKPLSLSCPLILSSSQLRADSWGLTSGEGARKEVEEGCVCRGGEGQINK